MSVHLKSLIQPNLHASHPQAYGSGIMVRRARILGTLIGILGVVFAASAALLLMGGTGVEILDVWVHRLDNAGRVAESWNVIGPHRVRPMAIPAWTSAEWNSGNVRIDIRFRNDLGHASMLRLDTQTSGRITGQVGRRCTTRPDLVHPRAEHVHMHWIRMWAEDITQECWIVEGDTGRELAYLSFELTLAPRAMESLLAAKIN